ncbi:hypothetical protein KAW64_08140 [bacterium]|nr:hypothetical protein [bacterium]
MKPLVDTNVFVAVATVFEGPADPWAKMLIRQFADVFIYADGIRFTVPTTNIGSTDPTQGLGILKHLYPSLDMLEPVYLAAPDPLAVSDESVGEAFDGFVSWIMRGGNRELLTHWLATHPTNIASEMWQRHLGREFVFDVDRLRDDARFPKLLRLARLNAPRLLYAFDNILRYPFYGRLTGPNEYYLNHPLRSSFSLPGQTGQAAPPPPIPVSWGESAWRVAKSTDLHGFIGFLASLRLLCRDTYGLKHLPESERIDRTLIREIAARADVPAALRGKNTLVTVLAAGAQASALRVGTSAALAAAALVTIAGSYWSGSIPRGTARISWLRWALHWREETQAREGS